jgi:hypothetical protein
MKLCQHCEDYGYINDNGQHVCKYGANFDFKMNAYYPEFAERCLNYRPRKAAEIDKPKEIRKP